MSFAWRRLSALHEGNGNAARAGDRKKQRRGVDRFKEICSEYPEECAAWHAWLFKRLGLT